MLRRDEDWFNLSINGKQIGDDEMRCYLDSMRLMDPEKTGAPQVYAAPRKE
jgi:hypothetical protein